MHTGRVAEENPAAQQMCEKDLILLRGLQLHSLTHVRACNCGKRGTSFTPFVCPACYRLDQLIVGFNIFSPLIIINQHEGEAGKYGVFLSSRLLRWIFFGQVEV